MRIIYLIPVKTSESEQLGGREPGRQAGTNDQGPDIDLRIMWDDISKVQFVSLENKYILPRIHGDFPLELEPSPFRVRGSQRWES